MDRENQPRSLQSPWWLGKARRHNVLLKFIIICVVVALLFLGLVIFAVKPRGSRGCGASSALPPKSGQHSVMPVWSFMDDLPADHSHCSGNVAEPSLINGERIGGQDGQVRQLAGLQ